MITQKELKELFHYNPETGDFIRLKQTSNRVKVGEVAGSLRNDGYIKMSANGKSYLAHRLAFLCMTGEFPEHQVDHVNQVKDDNRWINLRAVTHHENQRNKRISKYNASGFNGVHWCKSRGKWRAQITNGGKAKHLGMFHNLNDAISARKTANIEYEFHPNHGGLK